MANRVTSAEVVAIMDTNLTASDMPPFIELANMIVTDDIAGQGYSTARLKLIEKLLSAHFATLKEKVVNEEELGDGNAKYQPISLTAKGYETTTYGQQALLLDTNSVLKEQGKISARVDAI